MSEVLTLEALDQIIASKRGKAKIEPRLTERERLGQRIENESLSTADSLQLMNEEMRSGAPASQTRFIPENLKPLAKAQEEIKTQEKLDEARDKESKKRTVIRSKQVTNVMGRLRTALQAQKSTKEGTPEGDAADQDVEAARLQLDKISGRQFGELEAEVRGEVGDRESKQEQSVDISDKYPNQTPTSLATGFVTYRNGRSIDEIVGVMQGKGMTEPQIQAVLDEIARIEDENANK